MTMSSHRRTDTSSTASSTAAVTNGYHTPTSPASFTDDHHGEESYLASREQYAKILYEHTMKQMERFAREARNRGTLSMDHYPVQQAAAVAGN